jgi:hypothetical protein
MVCLRLSLQEGGIELNRKSALIPAIAVALSLLWWSPALPRQWKATTDALARDYASITDVRPGGDIVVLMWFVPPMVSPNSPGAPQITAMMQKYVLVMAAHGHVDKTTGSVSFEDVDALEAKDQAGKALVSIPRTDLVPTTFAVVGAVEAMFRQSLGLMGKGTKMFVFEAGNVDACKKGQLSVPLANETYTWSTPVPGCAQN